MRIAKLDIAARVDRCIRRIEKRAKRGSRHVFLASYIAALKREIAIAYLAKGRPITVAILVQRNAVVRRRTVEFPVEKTGRPITPVVCGGKKILDPIRQLLPKS